MSIRPSILHKNKEYFCGDPTMGLLTKRLYLDKAFKKDEKSFTFSWLSVEDDDVAAKEAAKEFLAYAFKDSGLDVVKEWDNISFGQIVVAFDGMIGYLTGDIQTARDLKKNTSPTE